MRDAIISPKPVQKPNPPIYIACNTSPRLMPHMAARDGDFAAVDAHYAKAVAIDPDNAKIYFNLGMARIAEKRSCRSVPGMLGRAKMAT